MAQRKTEFAKALSIRLSGSVSVLQSRNILFCFDKLSDGTCRKSPDGNELENPQIAQIFTDLRGRQEACCRRFSSFCPVVFLQKSVAIGEICGSLVFGCGRRPRRGLRALRGSELSFYHREALIKDFCVIFGFCTTYAARRTSIRNGYRRPRGGRRDGRVRDPAGLCCPGKCRSLSIGEMR